MVQIAEINRLLDLYIHYIIAIRGKFLEKFGRGNPVGMWRQGLIDRIGFLDDNNKIEYSFHGAGCTVELENGEVVSFDFSEDGGFTFDLFKLNLFVSSVLPDKEEEVDKLFRKLTLYKVDDYWVVGEMD